MTKSYKSYIYFLLREGDTPLIKIGKTLRPVDRFREHFRKYDVSFLGMLETTDPNLERKLLDKFEYCRVYGEWFNLDEKLVDFIIENCPEEYEFECNS